MYFDAVDVAQLGMEMRACTATLAPKTADNAVQHAFAAAQAHEASRTEVLEVMGRQAAYIVKDLDPMEALADPTAVEAMRLEYGRLESAMGEVVDLDSLPEDAIIVKARMLIGIKNWEDPSKRKPKGRMVAMGNVLYNKRMGVLRDGDVGDLWAPVATLTGVRVVEARAAAHKRRTTGIDLVAAYTQIPMGGKRPYYIIMPQVVHQIISEVGCCCWLGAGFRRSLRCSHIGRSKIKEQSQGGPFTIVIVSGQPLHWGRTHCWKRRWLPRLWTGTAPSAAQGPARSVL
jgi:hypothetical protein